ncbi:PTS ascorbate transporter subunit IIC [Sporolactobacillus shoreicorticis]|uniref:Ascorbate-specific PTS system EIIC component n=1 Tax=Sporolactobacillus shoreicorticis TaxID=1923877 RepID=A0ABW5RZU0_9BACL|nr:PTS ascorbate transporter subunit IIC [Sporolactobacillus shoreicorticis]MCO7128163.1 PTS ascorbate transporter subunit IIC [Sporolactobacillus shoreicorticis]
MNSFVQVLIKDVLGTPAILVGLFALVGLLLQKKDISKVVTGTLKTVMGFLILSAGANFISIPLNNFSKMFGHAFTMQGVVPNTDVMSILAQNKFGTLTAVIMISAMILNIILAKYTRFKYIFLTGHHIMYFAAMLAFIFSISKVNFVVAAIFGAVIEGVWMVLSPAILQPFTRKIVGRDDLAVGHFGSLSYLVSAWVGKAFGNKNLTTENVKVPKQLSFLRDSSVSISITMALLFLILAPIAGSDYVQTTLSSGQNFIVFSLLQAINFAAGVYIILAGVRMIISEILPAFKGIADKLVKGAKPALDCPTVFPFAPNAVVIGFLSAFVGGIICMFLTPVFGLAVVVPGLVPMFFCGGTAGVYGNSTGGLRGAILGSLVTGLLLSFLPAILLIFLGHLGYATTWGDSDFDIIGSLLSGFFRLFD